MAEIMSDNKIKPIAFYLPQYHSIPENDYFWGEGFTEWTNVKKAKPLFDGHNQPRVPLDNKYYDLLDDNVKVYQAELAKKYKVFGFCYYHYWFKDGKKLLEKPAEQMIRNKKIDIPFCFSWANENWSKKWDGGNQEIIAEQNYGEESDWKEHINYLIPFFKDERYITCNGDPIFLIYKPELIPNLEKMLKYWDEEMKKSGFNRICYMIQNCGWYYSPSYDASLFDYQIEFEPFFSLIWADKNMKRLEQLRSIRKKFKIINMEATFDKIFDLCKSANQDLHRGNMLTINNYDDVWNTMLQIPFDDKLIRGVFCDWDNTPRNKNGRVFTGVTSKKFEENFMKIIPKVYEQKCPIVFINAWNEWGEGTYMEPDTKNGYAYLEAVKKGVEMDWMKRE